ncbi:3-phenylpropionate/trans-cinnamate dioxygenase ferredoxin reductase subunit [Paraburkholderia sp. GAS41]|jgi:3-phenylpropionate/trans-cinnamate dioxygenase ferredoxin reductase subunit|uniref:NAD(P)/FAD-dependent oxidoreductase n=1 Tax=Paraburkholderia sp. GAS41 TaxID=3035134 RepID=UPI003D205EFB
MAIDRLMAIVGAGHVGGRAAQALREYGWKGGIALIGAELHLPYERPPLSKGLLTGERDATQCALRPREAWQQDDIEHVVARVKTIDSGSREIRLEDGRVISYEALLLATGGHPRRLTIPGAELPGVVGLRTLDDAAAIAPRLTPAARVVIIGGGFIGLEVAASARTRGCHVWVLEGAPRLLGRAVPASIATRVQALHERNGVDVRINTAPTSIEQMPDEALAVTLANGDVLIADLVIVGIGIDPADELARVVGLEVRGGVIVNKRLETSVPGIYAAGDVAVFPSRFSGQLIRQETWHNAETQARIAAHNMLGAQETYEDLPWFWSDQYDHQLQVAGEPALGEHSVTRVLAGEAEIHFYFDAGGRLVGASGFGAVSSIAKEMRLARMLVERGISAVPETLVDVNVKLKSLL